MSFFNYSLKRNAAFFWLFLIIQLAFRNFLLFTNDIDESLVLGFFKANILGILNDICAYSYFFLFLSLYLCILPKGLHNQRFDRVFTYIVFFIFLYGFNFGAVSEYFFWEEFTSRFNFIAVDYLVYTNEVIGNIRESYNLPLALSGILVVTIIMFCIGRKKLFCKVGFRNKFVGLCVAVFAFFIFGLINDVITNKFQPKDDKFVLAEISKNGVKSLFEAYWNNEINYEKFYITKDENTIRSHIRQLLEEEELGIHFVSDDIKNITRKVVNKGDELHKNVVIVVMESMSSQFLEDPQNITPNLNELSKEGIFFNNTYATGTRTVRGLEAVTLSVPPTPGQSILRRKDNENLFSLGFIFKDRGYDTKFIYGGYGYFDNMNYFFENNGFNIVDRNQFSKEETHFTNAWGVSDEDLFRKVIAEADKSHASGKKFMDVVMTTSNHRPYTYPDGKIDIPSKTGGRLGGVKYADYAIGQFIKEAKTKPWFNDTVFVFVADHTHGSSGKNELSINKYHIPLIIYSPSFLKAEQVSKMTSQIDVAPILLGQLNFSYYTKFFGEDILHDEDEQPHVFVSNYQKVALIKNGEIIVLKPKKLFDFFKDDKMQDAKAASEDDDEQILKDAISYYQSASYWLESQKKLDTTIVKK